MEMDVRRLDPVAGLEGAGNPVAGFKRIEMANILPSTPTKDRMKGDLVPVAW
jgi:hypothetical protein